MSPEARPVRQRASPHRQAVAPLLGLHRQTIGHWLARYEAGGLQALLTLYVPAGQPSSLPSVVLAALAQGFRPPAGFASSVERRQWIQQTQPLDVNDHPLDTIVRTRFQTKRKVPRPRHTKTTLRPGGSFR
jgi:hypothetical protein